jgi:hypothetical protein
MKKISEVEEKPVTSSLNICPEAHLRPISQLIRDISFINDVTVILFLGVSFNNVRYEF